MRRGSAAAGTGAFNPAFTVDPQIQWTRNDGKWIGAAFVPHLTTKRGRIAGDQKCSWGRMTVLGHGYGEGCPLDLVGWRRLQQNIAGCPGWDQTTQMGVTTDSYGRP